MTLPTALSVSTTKHFKHSVKKNCSPFLIPAKGSVQRLSAIIDFVPDPMFAIDREGKIIVWNRAIEEMTGFTARKMIGEGEYEYAIPFYGIRRPMLVDQVMCFDETTAEKYEYFNQAETDLLAEVSISIKGNQRILWGKAGPLCDSKGKLFGAIEVLRDITRKRKDEESLKQSEEKFEKSFRHIPVLMAITTIEDSRFIEANNAFLATLQYRRNEVIGKTSRELGIFVDPRKRDELEKRAIELGNVRNRDMQIRTKSGDIRYGIFSIELITLQGTPCLLTEMIDITSRKIIECALRKSETRFRQIAENVNDGFWCADIPVSKFSYVNSAFETICGISKEKLYLGAEAFCNILHPDDRAMVIEKRNSGAKWSCNYRIIRPDGQVRWLRCRGFPVKDAAGKNFRIVGITTDITDYKKVEAAAEVHRRQLILAEKMASLGVLVSGIAHEINNPNNFLMLNARIITRAWDDILPIIDEHYSHQPKAKLADLAYKEARQLLPDIMKGLTDGTNRIKIIVDTLRNYARHDSAAINQKVDINKEVESSLILLSNLVKRSTDHFSLELADNLPLIRGNGQQIEQVIINLITNACQALENRSRSITVSTSSNREEVLLRVIDEGIGMSPEIQGKIMDPFFTTKRESGGTGLGLPISLNIIQNHRGRIEIASQPGAGTTMTVHFPVCQEMASS